MEIEEHGERKRMEKIIKKKYNRQETTFLVIIKKKIRFLEELSGRVRESKKNNGSKV